VDAGDWSGAARLAAALEVHWHTTGRAAEGLRWLERVLAHELSPTIRGTALVAAARLAAERGDPATSAGHASSALIIARATGDPRLTALALMAAAGAAYYQGAMSEVEARLAEAVPLLEATGERWQLIFSRFGLGAAALASGRWAAAEELTDEAVRGFAELGDQWGMAAAEANQAMALAGAGHHAEAIALDLRALERFERLGDRGWAIATQADLALILVESDDEQALRHAIAAGRDAHATDQPAWISNCLLALALVALRRGRAEDAARALGAHAAVTSIHVGVHGRALLEDAHARVVSAVGDRAAGLLRDGGVTPPIEIIEAAAGW
jgi:hypothetical protein